MLTSTIILGVLAAVLLFIGYYRGEAQHIQGVKAGFTMLVEILPLLLFAFIGYVMYADFMRYFVNA